MLPLWLQHLTWMACTTTVWRPVWLVTLCGWPLVKGKWGREDILAPIWSNNPASEGTLQRWREEHMGGSLTVMAFEVKSVNGTNILSSPANPLNHREITREDTACTSCCFFSSKIQRSSRVHMMRWRKLSCGSPDLIRQCNQTRIWRHPFYFTSLCPQLLTVPVWPGWYEIPTYWSSCVTIQQTSNVSHEIRV